MEWETEGRRLKRVAEKAYTSSPPDLKSALTHATEAHRLFPTLDGLSEMLTAFQILSSAAADTLPDHYKVLQTQPFSPFTLIKKQFRKLALTLHPDKNPFPACQEAFKHVALGFTVLSDKTTRKDYDTSLRLQMLKDATEGQGDDTFQTVCVCGFMQRFQRTYLGHILRCPGCRNSFKALEENTDDTEEVIGSMFTDRFTKSKGLKPTISRVGEVLEREMPANGELVSDSRGPRPSKRGMCKGVLSDSKSKGGEIAEDEGLCIDNRALGSKRGVITEVLDKTKSNREEIEEDEITLAEVLEKSMGKTGNDSGVSTLKRRVGASVSGGSKEKIMEIVEDEITLAEVLGESIPTNGELGGANRVLRSSRGGKRKFWDESESNSEEIEEEGITLVEVLKRSMTANDELGTDKRVLRPKRGVGTRVSNDSKLKMGNIVEEGITLAEMQLRARKKVREEKMRLRVKEKRKEGDKGKTRSGDKKKRRASEDGDVEKMAVQDSDFYDFDKDRVERSFKKGQVWAVYDDDDGMPRHYGLIDEVSVYPFKIRLIWLDLESSANEELLSWENTGVHISCGRFKVAKTELIYLVNIFSHFVDAERAAREVYRIYPKKGSVWALFDENTLQNRDKRCFDLVVCLTSYDETYGLSMAYLEKVDGFKTVFKRREIGSHAIKWLAKADFRLFSHQIPARKLCGEEALDLSRDCWELDPASLPPELLRIGWHKSD